MRDSLLFCRLRFCRRGEDNEGNILRLAASLDGRGDAALAGTAAAAGACPFWGALGGIFRHAWQYRKNFQGAFSQGGDFFKKVVRRVWPQSKLELFLRTVEVASYLPGRIRLYSCSLVGCPPLAEEMKARLSALTGVTKAEVNTVTGSVLIEYDPETLRRDSALRRAEEYLQTRAKRKG